MSSIIIVTGRVTADPVMQQAKNSGTEYISLGLATNQRDQSKKEPERKGRCPSGRGEKIKKWNVEKNRSRLRMAPFLFVQKSIR